MPKKKVNYILGIDPGNVESAYCLVEGKTFKPVQKAKVSNEELLIYLKECLSVYRPIIAIECMQSFGMPVGMTVFDTCYFIGKIMQLCEEQDLKYYRVYRKEEQLHICNCRNAKDGNIRQALIDRFGVVGTKKNPGFFYGFKNDIWNAFAIALTASETQI